MLKIKNISKNFGKLEVLKDINLEIKEKEKVVIIGPSGSGKTTLLRCLNLLETPTSGEIVLEEQNISEMNKQDLRKKVGMIFQSFNLFANLTVMGNLILAPVKQNILNKDEAVTKAFKYLDEIGLRGKENEYPHNLSGGQRQRVAIIRALMMEPQILLIDEPTSSLDSEMIKEVLQMLKKIADNGMTMVIISHELDFAKEIATRIIFMDEGKIIETGSPTEIFKHPKTERLKSFLSNIS